MKKNNTYKNDGFDKSQSEFSDINYSIDSDIETKQPFQTQTTKKDLIHIKDCGSENHTNYYGNNHIFENIIYRFNNKDLNTYFNPLMLNILQQLENIANGKTKKLFLMHNFNHSGCSDECNDVVVKFNFFEKIKNLENKIKNLEEELKQKEKELKAQNNSQFNAIKDLEAKNKALRLQNKLQLQKIKNLEDKLNKKTNDQSTQTDKIRLQRTTEKQLCFIGKRKLNNIKKKQQIFLPPIQQHMPPLNRQPWNNNFTNMKILSKKLFCDK